MAEILGLNIETPQDIQNRINQQNQAFMQRAGNSRQGQRNANMMVSTNLLVGAFQKQRAERDVKELSETVESAMKDIPDNAPEEVKLRARLAANLKFADSKGMVNEGARIQQQLVQMDQAAYDRSVLMSRDARVDQTAQNNLSISKARLEILQKEVESLNNIDPHTTLMAGTIGDMKARTFNMSTEKGQQAYEAFRAEHPVSYEIDDRSLHDLASYGNEDEYDEPTMTPSAYTKQVTAANSSIRSLRLANNIADILRNNTTAPTAAGRLLAAGGKFANELAAAGSEFKALEATTEGAMHANKQKINTRLSENLIADTRLRGMAISLAYAAAQSRDSGRLSDADVEFALKSIGWNGSAFVNEPRAVLAAMKDEIAGSAEHIIGNMTRASSITSFAPYVADIQAELDTFDDYYESFQEPSVASPNVGKTPQEIGRPDNRFKASNGAVVGY